MSAKQFYVYLHVRPDGTPFYVGKGRGGRARRFTSGRNPHHKNIVAKHGTENIIVSIIPAESEEHAFWGEIELIKCFRALGYDMCNLTDGGEGASGHKQSEETIAKRVSKIKGKPSGRKGLKLTAGHCANLSAAKKGKPLSADHIAKLSAVRKGKPSPLKGRSQSPETLAKLSAVRKGKPAWNKGVPRSPETIAKLSAVRKGKPAWNKGQLGRTRSAESVAKQFATRAANRLKNNATTTEGNRYGLS